MIALIQLTEEISDEFFNRMIEYYNKLNIKCDWYYFDKNEYDITKEIQDLEEFYEELIAIRDFNDAYRLAQKTIKRGDSNENI